jgi:integrase/recombinase XerD
MRPGPVRTLCGVPHTTGCRISEALALTPERIDLMGRAVGCGLLPPSQQ